MRLRYGALFAPLAVLVLATACTPAPPPKTNPAHAVAVYVQSNSAALAPAPGADLITDLRARAEDPDTDDVVVHLVSARDVVDTVDLEPRRPNGQVERNPDRIRTLVAARLTTLNDAIARAAAAGTVDDPLGGLATAVTTGAGTVVLLGAGVSAADPIDQRVFAWDVDPARLGAELRNRGLLPRFDGEVVLSGLGRVAGDQPVLGVREQRALREQWLAVCAATGARCRLDDSVREPRPPSSQVRTPPVPALPVVTTSGIPSAGPVVWSVPAPLLFRADSCVVLDVGAAVRVLTPLIERLTAGGVRVSVSGRTAPVGPDDANATALALCRARAATDLLTGHGVPTTAIGAVTGDGSRLDPLPSGTPDPTELAARRRVVFTVEPVPATGNEKEQR